MSLRRAKPNWDSVPLLDSVTAVASPETSGRDRRLQQTYRRVPLANHDVKARLVSGKLIVLLQRPQQRRFGLEHPLPVTRLTQRAPPAFGQQLRMRNVLSPRTNVAS